MDENSNTLTSFDFGASVVDSGHESLLSKLYGKVKTAVSSHDTGDANSSLQDPMDTANDQASSFYEITNDDRSMHAGKTFDAADYLLSSSSKATLTDVSDLARTVTGGDLDRMPSHQGLVGGPAPTLSSSGKAPPTASVVITTATAHPSATTSAASSMGGATSSRSSSTSTSTGSNLHGHHHLPHTSSQIDTVSFSPSSSDRHFSAEEEDMKQRQAGFSSSMGNATITISDTAAPSPTPTHSGNSLTIPMTKSKSMDSDTQSIATNFSISNTNSLGKIMARLRGQKHDKEFWMPDEQCKECYKCRKQFTMFRRKHHCRFCGKNQLTHSHRRITNYFDAVYRKTGQIFCSKCASHIIPGKIYSQKGPVRICNFCYTEQHSNNPPSRPSPYETLDTTTDNTGHSTSPDAASYQPVIPSQNPPLAAPMMQIPTTAVKKPTNAKYGNENSTTVALEIDDHDAMSMLDRHHHSLYPGTPHIYTPTTPSTTSIAAANGNNNLNSPTQGAAPTPHLSMHDSESGGFKRLLDVGSSLLSSRSRSNLATNSGPDESSLRPTTSSTAINNNGQQQQQQQQQQQSRYLDHGGGTAVTENALSPFFCPENDQGESEDGLISKHQDMGHDGWHRSGGGAPSRSVSYLPISKSYAHSNPFRHGHQMSSSFIEKQHAGDQTSSSTGSDNESYDVQLRAKRTAELRGTVAPLRKRSNSSLRRQSTTGNIMGIRGRAFRHVYPQVNTSGLGPSTTTHDNWSPSSSSYLYSALTPADICGGYSNSPFSVDVPPPPSSSSVTMATDDHSNSNDDDSSQLAHTIKSNIWMARHRRVSGPTANVELSYSALGHARKLLRQLMGETSLHSLDEDKKNDWETVIMNLLLKMADHVQPDVRAGDDMDVRHYIKIKKIPGGVPSDSFYIKGVMCSKNVAHKRMAKNITEPRILILLFSLDYSRVEMGNQLLSIKPVISQEREHISKLVGRIIALRPSLLLVKSTVSRLALEILLEANIPVVHNVKYSVIEAVARCTQASVVSSVDKLRNDLFFGQCGSFEIRTYLHEWIPHRRKTLLIFGDCAPELGGTIVLRGGTEETLQTVKSLMDFMVFVVHNLKLETALLRDSFAKNRGLEQSQIGVNSNSNLDDGGGGAEGVVDDRGGGIVDQLPTTHKSDALLTFLKVYRDTILSASQYVVFPPPYLLTRLKETEDELATLDKETEAAPHPGGSLATMMSVSPTCGTLSRHPGGPSLPPVSYPSSTMLGSRYELLIAKQHQLNRAWDAYLRESPNYVSPFYHQNIVVLYSNVCTVTTMPCYGPEIRVFEYYRHPSDITLGQYLMSLFADALEPCPSPMCGYPALNHYLSYAHGDARVNVITQQFECPIPGMADKLLMWSYCKECKKATQVARVSENTWNYSFGKFLELFLYQQGVHCRADICPHEMGRHHVRFFGYMDLSVGFQYEPIDLLEVAVPPIKLFMLSQVQIDLKDNEQKLLRTKINKFYQSIIERNKAFPYDLVDPLQLNECKAELEELSDRSLGTKKKVLQILQNIYATTAKSDTLTINWVRRLLCQEMAEWDMEYADLVRRYLLPERELRKITTSQLRRIFPVDSTNAPYDSTTSSGTSGDFMGNERIKRSSETTDLPLLGIALDGDDEETMIGYMLKGTTRRSYALGSPPTILPLLSSSPDDTIRYDNDSDDSNDSDAQESDGSTARRRPSLLRPSIRRRLSRELNRELLLRFRASDTTKDDRSLPNQGIQTKSPGSTTAAMTPSRIPVPNININNTGRPQLSPPIYDTLATGALNAKSATALGGNRMPMAPIKVPSSFELNVSTPKLRASKDTPPHRNISGRENRISGQNESRAGIPPESPMFMQELYQQKQQRKQQQYDHYGGLQTQSLQHIPSMFKTQYANNDYGRRALGSIRRRITSPSNNESSNIVIPGGDATIGRLGSQHGPFRSRLPRKKTYIQVYTQANELVKEDMDDEFLVSDLDDLGDIDGSDTEEDSSNKNPPRIDKAALSDDTGSKTDGPVDYFSPHAPYSGTSVTSSSQSTSGAAVSSLTRTPVSTESVPALRSSSSMLERLDTGPSTDSGRSSNLLDNQLPLASDLLLSPAATSTSDTPGNKYDSGADEQQQQQVGKLPRNALIGRRTIDLEDAKHVEKTSFMKTITSFLTDNGTDNLLPLENPLNPMEHVLSDSFVVVREDEPSTIIAYTLSCDDYLKKMKEMRDTTTTTTTTTTNDTNSLFDDTNTIAESFDDITLDQSLLGEPSTNFTTTLDTGMTQAQIQDTLLKESESHMRYKQFDALRRQCGCDETYILSLGSCIKWDSVGGKSGSAFLKSKDDRLLMKQMSRFELDAFLGFAPAYFQYLSKAFFTELPTVLAKIFGFYSIGYKNSNTGKSMRMDVLVMENLFYQRNIKKIFDLKGSMRNRHVESTGKEDEVLLDENLVELIFQSPLFIRAHAKEILRSSLHNDTLFLSGHNVMDYSLLVGIDEERRELVVGIVDFIRTFTWDKKLESWVKESVFLGGGGKEPTIVSPRLYRVRFRAAMERYFLMVPDVWALARQNRLPSTYHHHHHHHHQHHSNEE
ncbi:hypothetical protein [Absidia glauca]|uniref:1-phosphatidylinositol-3-phosphate 5-kinase n=1 Tax=Absidia glauca TaxID=4829 RepID=A0A168NAE3_ABSGL|nr:hypothetical protein [Absidia glauca]